MADLFLMSRCDIFAIYPQILSSILAAENAKRNFVKDFINLPTDSDYQERVYYRLLAVQKAINDLIDSGVLVQIVSNDSNHSANGISFVCVLFSYAVRWTKSPKRKKSKAFGIQIVILF